MPSLSSAVAPSPMTPLMPTVPTGNQSPVPRRCLLRALRVTPGSTVTEKSSRLSSVMASMRLRSKQTPPWHGGTRGSGHGRAPRARGAQRCRGSRYLHGVDASFQAGTGAKGHHGHTRAVTQGCQLLHLPHRLGPHHHVRGGAAGGQAPPLTNCLNHLTLPMALPKPAHVTCPFPSPWPLVSPDISHPPISSLPHVPSPPQTPPRGSQLQGHSRVHGLIVPVLLPHCRGRGDIGGSNQGPQGLHEVGGQRRLRGEQQRGPVRDAAGRV